MSTDGPRHAVPERPLPHCADLRRGAGVHLAVPLAERRADLPSYRIGPHALPAHVRLGAGGGARWAAYWYQAHDRTCMTTCCCWTITDGLVRFSFDGGGDGVVFVQYVDETIGVYPLAHAREQRLTDLPRPRTAAHCLSVHEFRAFRDAWAGEAPRFGDGPEPTYTPPPGARAIWQAWDAAVAHFGTQQTARRIP